MSCFLPNLQHNEAQFEEAFVFKNAIFTAKSDIFFIEMQQIFFLKRNLD